MADELDHLVDVGDGDGEADQHVRPVARLVEQELGAAGDHLLAEVGERLDHVLEIEALRAATVDRQHIGAERRLQVGEAIELVEHHVGDGIALQFDDDAHAFAVGLVPDVGDAFDALVAHQVGDLLDQRLLVDLIGDRRDDQRLAVLAHLLDLDAGAHEDGAAPLMIGGEDAGAADDEAAGREVRALNDLAQLVDGDLGVLKVRQARVDHFAQVVRGNVGRHADGDTAGAVDQQVGELRRHHRRLEQAVVVVRLEVDRVLVEIVEQVLRDLRQPRLGVAFGGGRVAVDRAEVALAVDQRHAQGKLLRHAHQRVVDGEVTVRVEVTHRVAHDLGRLHVLFVPVEPQPLHGVEDAPVHGLQAVAHVGQRTRDDDAHRVLEVRALHLFGECDGSDVARLFAAGRLVVGAVGHDFVLSADSATHAFRACVRGC